MSNARNIANLPNGDDAPLFGCRAWVNFDGVNFTGNPSSCPIRDSGNVTSVIRERAGIYKINFDNPFPNADYTAVVGANINNSNEDLRRNCLVFSFDSDFIKCVTGISSGTGDTEEDYTHVTVSVFK